MSNFMEHPVNKEDREKKRETEREGGKGLKVEAKAPVDATRSRADESNQQAIPNGWKDMQMRVRETAVGNACLPGPRSWAQ